LEKLDLYNNDFVCWDEHYFDNIHVIWKEGTRHLYHSLWNKNTASWSAPTSIFNKEIIMVDDYAIAADPQGDLHVIWLCTERNGTHTGCGTELIS